MWNKKSSSIVWTGKNLPHERQRSDINLKAISWLWETDILCRFQVFARPVGLRRFNTDSIFQLMRNLPISRSIPCFNLQCYVILSVSYSNSATTECRCFLFKYTFLKHLRFSGPSTCSSIMVSQSNIFQSSLCPHVSQ